MLLQVPQKKWIVYLRLRRVSRGSQACYIHSTYDDNDDDEDVDDDHDDNADDNDDFETGELRFPGLLYPL